MNHSIQEFINGLAGHWGIADGFMKFASQYLIYAVIPLWAGMWFWPGEADERALHQRLVIAAAAAGMLALGAAWLLGHLYSQARPFEVSSVTKLLIEHSPGNGFPSDHASASFAMATTIAWHRRKLGVMMLLGAALIALARVYVGVHWPLDVAAGAGVGIVAGSVLAKAMPLLAPVQKMLGRYLPEFLVAHAK